MSRPIFRDGRRVFLTAEAYAAHMAEKVSRQPMVRRENISLGLIQYAGEVPEAECRLSETNWDEPTVACTERIAPEDRCPRGEAPEPKVTRTIHTMDRSEALRIARQRRGSVKNAQGGGYNVTFRD